MNTARKALMRASWASHQRLHRHPIFAPLTRPDLTREQYVRALTALWGFHAPLERRLTELGLAGGRLAALRADLLALGVTESPAECAGPPDLRDEVDGLAARWMLDGSARGGEAMAPNVRRALGLDEDSGLGFFTNTEPRAAADWEALSRRLDNALGHDKYLSQACRMAAALFGSLEIWLDEAAACSTTQRACR